MADIADEAGISRQSIYKVFEDRSTLLQYILVARIAELGASIKARFAHYANFEEVLVEGSILSVSASRADRMFTEIVTQATDHNIELFFLRGTPEVHQVMLDLWAPHLDEARRQGILRPGLTNDRVVVWLRHLHALLTFRSDQPEEEQRQLLRDFLVPSVVIATPSGQPFEATATGPRASSTSRPKSASKR